MNEKRGVLRAVNKGYGFELARAGAAGPWSVLRILKANSPEAARIQADVDDLTTGAINYFLVGSSIEMKSVLEPGVIKRIGFVQPQQLVKLEFDYRSTQPRVPDFSGWAKYDPGNAWIRKEFNFNLRWSDGTTGSSAAVFHYEQAGDNSVLLKRIDRRLRTSTGHESEDTYDFDMRDDDVPESVFTLGEYGFPEPGGIAPTKSTPWFLWLSLAGGICLCAGLFFRRREARTPRHSENAIRPARHGAFTLVELLVVIAIVGLLIALSVPAVQKVRDASMRIHCVNNLKQVGLAAHQYHGAVKRFPAGMRYQNRRDPYLMSTWLTQLLPYVEQEGLWGITETAYRQARLPFRDPPHEGLATVIGTFVCPADGRAGQIMFSDKTRTRVAFTSYLGVEGQDLYTQDGILFRDSHVSLTDITDGTSQTLLAGERPPSADLQFGWWYAGAGQGFTGSADSVLGVQEQNVLSVARANCPAGIYTYGPGNPREQCDMFHFWSMHTGGAHFLFADGSVHFLPYSAAPILSPLASRAGGEVQSCSYLGRMGHPDKAPVVVDNGFLRPRALSFRTVIGWRWCLCFSTTSASSCSIP